MIFLTSCGSRSQLATVSPTHSLPTQIATAIPARPIPTNNQQVFVDPIEKHCAKTIPAEEFTSNENSVLFLFTTDPYVPYFSDPLNKTKNELHSEPGFAPYGILISPDHKLAALTISTAEPPWQTTKLQIIDSAGEVQKEFPWKKEWGRVDSWLDNHRILIAKQADLQLSNYNPTSIILLDTDTGQDAEIQSTYPGLNQVTIVNWSLINHIYSPDFSRVLYLTSKEDPGHVNYFALWDLENKQVLATLPIELGETWKPQWSPDGSQVLISGLVAKPGEISNNWRGKELFTIEKNGKINQLTHFTDYYPGTVTIADCTWSPDGQNIAFWLQTKQMDKPELVTLNINTGEIVNHCITAIQSLGVDPVWWTVVGLGKGAENNAQEPCPLS
jgi:hypothetical protein